VPVTDRWAIAAYLRALQLSRRAPPDDVPAERRAELDRAPEVPPPATLSAPGAPAAPAGLTPPAGPAQPGAPGAGAPAQENR